MTFADPDQAPLHRLATDVERASLQDLWRMLSIEERREAVEAGLATEEPLIHDWAVVEVAAQRHFREKSVEKWPEEKLAAAAALLRPRSAEVVLALLVAFHLQQRRALLATYLEGLGLEHRDGWATEEQEQVVQEEEARAAASALLDSFPARDVLVYLLTLHFQAPHLVPDIEGWLPDILRADALQVTEPPSEELEEEGAAPSGATPEETHEFTTLDRQLVRTIVDVAQEIEGALEPDAVVDLVEELIELNSNRHRSFFHLGFADVVLDRTLRSELPAQNESRVRWYWAGVLNGLAREARWSEIVEHFDAEPAVRALGQSGQGASSTSARLVFRALIRADRPGDAAGFLTTAALLENPRLTALVHEEATKLLGQDRAAEARALMDLLGGLPPSPSTTSRASIPRRPSFSRCSGGERTASDSSASWRRLARFSRRSSRSSGIGMSGLWS